MISDVSGFVKNDHNTSDVIIEQNLYEESDYAPETVQERLRDDLKSEKTTNEVVNKTKTAEDESKQNRQEIVIPNIRRKCQSKNMNKISSFSNDVVSLAVEPLPLYEGDIKGQEPSWVG